MPKIEIMPSILAADMGDLAAEIRRAEEAGADQIHVDVMDGVFVPNISMGPAVVEMADRTTDLPLDVHLMLLHPQNYVETFANAGADSILIHVEAECDIEDTLKKIRALGCRPGLTLNPSTTPETVFQWTGGCTEEGTSCLQCLDKGLVDEVLVMSVEPGYGGQSYMQEVEDKMAAIRRRFPEVLISVDGGIGASTVESAAAHGANLFVAGTALFRAPDMKEAIRELRSHAEQAFNSLI